MSTAIRACRRIIDGWLLPPVASLHTFAYCSLGVDCKLAVLYNSKKSQLSQVATCAHTSAHCCLLSKWSHAQWHCSTRGTDFLQCVILDWQVFPSQCGHNFLITLGFFMSHILMLLPFYVTIVTLSTFIWKGQVKYRYIQVVNGTALTPSCMEVLLLPTLACK